LNRVERLCKILKETIQDTFDANETRKEVRLFSNTNLIKLGFSWIKLGTSHNIITKFGGVSGDDFRNTCHVHWNSAK
jgi:hypothetical protein